VVGLLFGVEELAQEKDRGRYDRYLGEGQSFQDESTNPCEDQSDGARQFVPDYYVHGGAFVAAG
jgi:hypothetical protein